MQCRLPYKLQISQFLQFYKKLLAMFVEIINPILKYFKLN